MRHWLFGGSTDLPNLVLLCDTDHGLAHDLDLVMSRRAEGQPSPFPKDMLEIAIPDSAHHIMIDQPLALIAALRALLSAWPS